ncbi:MAG: PDZ domain-containing protein [Planctomycetota bacterium]
MGSPDPELAQLFQRFVPVRVTDLRGFDLDTFEFDFDLTLAVLTAGPGGRVYHRFGGRDHRSADRYVTVPGLEAALRSTLARFEAEVIDAGDMDRFPPVRRIEDFPSYGPWLEARGEEPTCIHCHQVGEHEIRTANLVGESFDLDRIWRWPAPTRVGFDVDPDDQTRVVRVDEGSAAAAAGLRAGDRVATLGGVQAATFTDLQFALHRAEPGATRIPLAYERAGEPADTALVLGEGWKRGDPLTFAWRPLKWGLPHGPGFGGRDIGPDRKAELGLDPDAHAFAVDYFVTWGAFGHRGRAAEGPIRRGDVVYAVDGKDDFQSQDHFHAWFRLTREEGATARIGLVRGGEKRVVELVVQR